MLRSIVVRPALRLFQVYETSVARRPVLTQLAVGTALVGLGDAAAQHLIEKRDMVDHDWRRTGNMVLLRGVIHSGMIIYWYRFLHAKVPMTGYSTYPRLAVHLTLDQCVFGPSNVLFFFVASGVLEGKDKQQIGQKLHERFWETIASALVLWVRRPFNVSKRFRKTDWKFTGTILLHWIPLHSYPVTHGGRSSRRYWLELLHVRQKQNSFLS